MASADPVIRLARSHQPEAIGIDAGQGRLRPREQENLWRTHLCHRRPRSLRSWRGRVQRPLLKGPLQGGLLSNESAWLGGSSWGFSAVLGRVGFFTFCWAFTNRFPGSAAWSRG